MKINEHLKSIREDKGLTQSQIADLMNKSQPAYARIELGQSTLSVDDLELFAKAVGMNSISVIRYPDHLSGSSVDPDWIETERFKHLIELYVNHSVLKETNDFYKDLIVEYVEQIKSMRKRLDQYAEQFGKIGLNRE